MSLFRKQNRSSFKRWNQTIINGVSMAAMVAVGCAILGIVIEVVSSTGLGMKLPFLILKISKGNLYLVLPLIALASLFLGCGLPSIAVYMLMASLLSPVLVKIGYSVLQSHLFPFYFGVFSQITLPVAVAAVITSTLAGSTYMKTGWAAMKVGAGAFILPFLIVWAPSLLLVPSDFATFLIEIVGALLLILTLQVAITGWFLSRLNNIVRGITLIALFAMIGFFITHKPLVFYVSVCAFIIVLIEQLLRRKMGRHGVEAQSHLEHVASK
jgi:TRAP-type uncharacterized transport system fused permease subunit